MVPLRLKPNANHVAAKLAISATRSGLKSIVFVNTKNDAVSVAGEISDELNEKIDVTEAEQERWDALEARTRRPQAFLAPSTRRRRSA